MYKYQEATMFEVMAGVTPTGAVDFYFCLDGEPGSIVTPQKNEPITVYHYCSVKALEGILQSKSMWLSSIFHTNDSTEVKYFVDILDDYLKSLNLNERESLIVQVIRATVILNLMASYSTSFTTLRDNLSQWRGYGDDGYGVAIGFSTKYLPMTRRLPHRRMDGVNPKTASAFLQVFYDKEKHIETIEDIITRAITGDIEAGRAGLSLAKIAYTCKHLSFVDEQEWRILYTPLHDRTGTKFLINDSDHKDNEFNISQLKRRENNKGQQIPYCEFPILENYMKEIIVGPKNNEDMSIINKQLSNLTYEEKKLTICKSCIPYR